MRGFLNTVFLLLVAGVALIALSPVIVLALEVYQDPYVIGIECFVSEGKMIARAWYKGSLRISDATLTAIAGNTTIGSTAAQEISRDRNITLGVKIPDGVEGKGDLVISLSITIEGLYKANMILRGCS